LAGAPLVQAGEKRINVRHAHAARPDDGRQLQVFRHVQAGKDGPFLRADGNATARDQVRWQVDQLVAFERVAREGSFSRAAVALDIGQPAVSARILALEDELGGSLFVRARSIRLTALGSSLLPYVRRTLEVLREGVEAARLAQVGQRGSIRVGALGSLAAGLVGPVLAEFLRSHPRVECTLKAANHEVLLQYLLDGLVDVALVVWPCASAVELTPLFVFREPVVLIAHPRHRLARAQVAGLDPAPDVRHDPQVGPVRSGHRVLAFRTSTPK